MIIDIGVDFGSTYTMVSIFEDNQPTTIQPDGKTYSYPSIVVFDEMANRYFCGNAASGRMGKPNTVTYRGFKMLLNEQMDEANLQKRGYTKDNTPEMITELFLRYVISNTLKKKGARQIGTLVVGAPECWLHSFDTADAKTVLRSICNRIKNTPLKNNPEQQLIQEVKIISEPINAAAFSIWNYKQTVSEKLDGKILVVDYGGGTLDTSLVEVRQYDTNLRMKSEMRSGAGENQDHQIGSAGIAYQEAVVRLAISEALGIKQADILCDENFDSVIKDFEDQLVSQTDYIKEIFQDHEFDEEDSLKDEYFCSLSYGTNTVTVNFYHLHICYQEIISPVLIKVLDETTKGLQDSDLQHIALVGGFCNFYLVEKDIYKYFKIAEKDPRIQGMIREEADREKAIAHGASLFAANIITVCNVAEFSIGTYVERDGKRFDNHYAIRRGQEIKVDTVYFAMDAQNRPYPMIAGNFDRFLLNFSKEDAKAQKVYPIQKFKSRLKNINCGILVVIGFSMDAEERITVHIYNYDMDKAEREETPVARIELSTFRETFGGNLVQA